MERGGEHSENIASNVNNCKTNNTLSEMASFDFDRPRCILTIIEKLEEEPKIVPDTNTSASKGKKRTRSHELSVEQLKNYNKILHNIQNPSQKNYPISSKENNLSLSQITLPTNHTENNLDLATDNGLISAELVNNHSDTMQMHTSPLHNFQTNENINPQLSLNIVSIHLLKILVLENRQPGIASRPNIDYDKKLTTFHLCYNKFIKYILPADYTNFKISLFSNIIRMAKYKSIKFCETRMYQLILEMFEWCKRKQVIENECASANMMAQTYASPASHPELYKSLQNPPPYEVAVNSRGNNQYVYNPPAQMQHYVPPQISYPFPSIPPHTSPINPPVNSYSLPIQAPILNGLLSQKSSLSPHIPCNTGTSKRPHDVVTKFNKTREKQKEFLFTSGPPGSEDCTYVDFDLRNSSRSQVRLWPENGILENCQTPILPSSRRNFNNSLNSQYTENVINSMELQSTNETTRSSASRDSGFMSPLNFNSDQDNMNAAFSNGNNEEDQIIITHVTSLSKDAAFISTGSCNVCTNKTNKRCVGCYNIYYCSRECQSAEWNVHKFLCYPQ
ncbi:unnamed protein product [Leptosia nina]|uniref:MYND-type domain-containing protein n=1 Tax=Leptosia nina TaxID=320188 RepID=A0AAV1K3G7_9NEOP